MILSSFSTFGLVAGGLVILAIREAVRDWQHQREARAYRNQVFQACFREQARRTYFLEERTAR